MHTVPSTNPNVLSLAVQQALVDLLLQLADDDLIFGHRSSEWLGVAPDLEEDIAFSSISQDEVGHAALFYELVQKLAGEDADALAFARSSTERKNARLLERNNGDWAFTIARGFMYNAFEHVRLQAALQSTYLPLQQAAQKIVREERYHLLHMQTWFENLGIAGGEARSRLEKGIASAWMELPDLFSLGHHAAILVEEGILPSTEMDLYKQWAAMVQPVFEKAGLPWPGDAFGETKMVGLTGTDGRTGAHSPDLEELLNTMTEVYRSNVQAKW
ncbi:phenylacetate-CoA oxygenase subunit PaaC [Alicyclobacillus tolerans]|uniref:1,2-phenylacetyl-CoA epoxidase subunit PaaC n=1 Tax=Alicyclobacillus tolerans TaxID=90970 RepID=UPI001F00D943|nr:1,2-phenylacetyl-CoA epoxidase subunit PaaC [Alicyclobacillus tolerans]MCF8568085.1 phenylacetate-CoA oxygenase subunit PaaC [Alicyclobacillus tolerans]